MWGAAHARSTADVGALSAAFGQGARIQEAEGALATAIAMAPAEFDMFVRRRVAWHRPEDHANIARGFGKAGWEGRIRLQVPLETR